MNELSSALSNIEIQLRRIADALERLALPQKNPDVRDLLPEQDASISHSKYIQRFYGESKENADQIVSNCQTSDDDEKAETQQ